MQKIEFQTCIDASDVFGSPLIEINKDHLEVQLPKYFRDQSWANSIGLIQEAINQYKGENTIQHKVVFDFNKCRWIDPLPLMSVLIEVINARHLGMSILIRLPEPDNGLSLYDNVPYQKSPNRLLYFMSQEGFLDCLDRLNDDGIRYSDKPDISRELFRNLNVRPSYEDARCIPMSLFMVPKEGQDPSFAKRSVDELLTGITSKLDSKIAPHIQERLIYKLRVALQEVILNVHEHAYKTDTDQRLLAIYVRYRTGGHGLDTAGRLVFNQCVREENDHCPTLTADWLTVRPGCLELFVLDRGIGMVRSFEKAGIQLSWKYKITQVLEQTFFHGVSTKPERQTLYGGLHLLHNLLIETGDFVRALEDGVWFGCSVPLFRPKSKIRSLTKAKAKMHGLAMHLRLGWKKETDRGENWAKFEQGKQSEIWPELSLSEHNCEASFCWFENQIVIDDRFSELKTYGRQSDWILLLVRPHRMKWDILTFIERNIVPHASKKTVLIIADIPSYEAETYVAALAKYKAPGVTNWPAKFSHIILCTNRWRFAVIDYKKHEARHGFSQLHKNFKSLRIIPPPIKPKPANFRLAIVRWLKWHDSRRLWEEISNNELMYIPEKVVWGKDTVGKKIIMEGYLDFPLTTHNNLCMAIYRTALSRVLGILPRNKITITPLDRLTMTVLREIHATEMYEPTTDLQEDILALGSVLVSGSTLEASALRALDLHFFIHYSSPLQGSKPALLFWLPKDVVSNAQPRLARIGRTAAIAPEGWKSFEVPRFDDKRNCVGARNPKETYQDWQGSSPVIVKAGHWSYEGHHDFLTVNIESAVEAAFIAKNELARFLVRRILPFIGLNKVQVDENWHRLLENQPVTKRSSESSLTNYGLLVYRSHPCSDSIVRRLLDILTPEGRTLAISRIFPILPIRMRWSGSTLLIPPLMREDIRKAMNQGGRTHPVLLFDDAAITGRTLNDLRTALSAIGATEVHTFVIANRLRQPADGFGKERLDYFWRLDLPVMGRGGNCPLCHYLDLANQLLCSLTANNAKKEIMDWRQRWGETSPLDNWSSGLRPLPLLTPEKETRYCYRQTLEGTTSEEEKYLARINLIRSTGLSIHVAELHAMTGRDDYCLKKIREHSEPEIRIELAASQLLLFGNEFDIDISVELVKVLITELARLKDGSPHAPLAALTVMGGLGLLDRKAKCKAAKMVQEDDWALASNYVTNILLAYLVSDSLIDHDTVAYKKGKRLLSSASWPLSQRFNEWFLETLSPHGNAHSQAIPKLIDDLKQATEITDMKIRDAFDSLEHLSDLINGLDAIQVRRDVATAFKEKKATMSKAADEVKCLLHKKLSNLVFEGWRQSTKDALETYMVNMKSVADDYFHRIPSVQEYWCTMSFETNALSYIINSIDWKMASSDKYCDGNKVSERKRKIEITHSNVIGFDSNAVEIWIPWHHGITHIVGDLLQNAVYSKNEIHDPWSRVPDILADLWIRVDYNKESLLLIMANASSCTSDAVYENLQKKKHRWTYLMELGGGIEPVNIPQQYVAGIQLRIPYAGYAGL